jgi:hypothetical protein
VSILYQVLEITYYDSTVMLKRQAVGQMRSQLALCKKLGNILLDAVSLRETQGKEIKHCYSISTHYAHKL